MCVLLIKVWMSVVNFFLNMSEEKEEGSVYFGIVGNSFVFLGFSFFGLWLFGDYNVYLV